MRTLAVIVAFWLMLTWAIARADWIAALLLLPAFLIVWSWSEQLDGE